MEPAYKFALPIGDWSGDGHERCEYYRIASNKPIKDVREAHFNIVKATGINVEDICSTCDEDWIDDELMEMLKDMGFEPSNQFGDENILAADDMAHIWLILLMRTDPTLKLSIIKEEELDMLPFVGYDKKGRHIGAVGYGVLG